MLMSRVPTGKFLPGNLQSNRTSASFLCLQSFVERRKFGLKILYKRDIKGGEEGEEKEGRREKKGGRGKKKRMWRR